MAKDIKAALDERQRTGEVRALKRENTRLRASVTNAEAARKHAEHELDEVRATVDFYESAPRLSPVLMNPDKRRRTTGNATAILALGDWHVEERVDPKTVNGFNEHTPDIASKKIKTTFSKAIELIEVERSMSNIGEMVVALLGDFITGYIHPELEESNYSSPTEAIIFAADHIAGGLEMLLREFKGEIIVPAVCGNHGRTTPKQRIATSYKNSYEWAMYKFLEREFRNQPRVKWKIENGYHNYVNVQGRVVRIHHGHAFKYQGGIQGPAVPIRRKVAQWDTQKAAWMDLFGHLHIHEVIQAGKIVINGPLIGYGAYGEFAVGGKCPAMQTLIVVDSTRDIPTAIKPIFCTGAAA